MRSYIILTVILTTQMTSPPLRISTSNTVKLLLQPAGGAASCCVKEAVGEGWLVGDGEAPRPPNGGGHLHYLLFLEHFHHVGIVKREQRGVSHQNLVLKEDRSPLRSHETFSFPGAARGPRYASHRP